jgi:HEPN domain-containing protein
MTRCEFQSLAEERLADAEALLGVGRYGCAYYVAGYAIECGLKACIARKTKQDDFPPRDAQRYYVHDIPRLLDCAGLTAVFAQEVARDPAFQANWAVVKDWNEESRYQSRNKRQAEEILAAIQDSRNGVLQWLKRNW